MLVPRFLLPAVAAAIVTTTIETAAVVRGRQGSTFAVVALLLLVTAAALLARDREQRGNALLLELGAVAAALSDLEAAIGSSGLQLGFTARFWAVVLLAWFFFRYPDRRMRVAAHRWILGGLALFGVVGWAIDSLLWDPARLGYGEPNHWLTVGDWEDVRDQVQLWSSWAMTVGLLAGGVALIVRWRTARGFDRVAVRSVAIAGALLALVVAGTGWIDLVYTRYVAADLPDLGAVREGALGVATALVLFEALRRRSAAVAVVDELFAIGSDSAAVLAVLQSAFADPRLTMHEVGSDPGDRRVVLAMPGRDGHPVGFVETDESARRDPAWSRTVLAAAGVVVENSRLHADVVESLAEVRSSRARLVEAGLDERRRVERDLHDGAQQHLLAVASSIGRLELVDDDSARRDAIGDAKAQLSSALAELRRLARGIYPPVLTQAGVAAALRTLPDTTDVPVAVDIGDEAERRYRPAVESTAWFVACESVANAVKHAAPTRVTVRLAEHPDGLHIAVDDDGAGGAAIKPAGGLAGLEDRVHALGGTLTVTSPVGAGTSVVAIVPVT